MNKTVELVNKWAEFEEKYPNSSIEDFCRYQLIHKREMENDKPLVGGVVPGISSGLLLKILGRIHKMNASYASAALEGTGITQLEEFGLLLTIQQQKAPRKTDVVYLNLLELSSGSDMLTRLKKRGFIDEYADMEDKRSKRLMVTPAGEKVIMQCKHRVAMVARMIMVDVEEEDQKLCIKLLKGVEQKLSALAHRHKGMSFDDVYGELMGRKK
jgi:DNA-binding MarR family transcriptional regulator